VSISLPSLPGKSRVALFNAFSIRVATFLVALGVALNMSALAEETSDSPTLPATQSWLESHLPRGVNAYDSMGYDYDFRTYHVHDCQIDVSFSSHHSSSSVDATEDPYYVVTLYPRSGLQIIQGPIHEKIVKHESVDLEDFSFTDTGSVSILLRNVDVSRVSLDKWKVSINPMEHSAAFLDSLGTNEASFATLDGDLAGRTREALLHAANLCGATKDVF
jgi:hypothetical protein